VYAVILAGGGGTRLWPLSRPDRPKPFLPLIDDDTLLQHTVKRLGPIRRSDVFVVTHRRYADLVREQLKKIGDVIEEPEAKNTAAAIALATVAIDRPEDEVMAVLPADHSVRNESQFRATLYDAGGPGGLAEGAFGVADPLVTLGIQISRPATEYGYLIPDRGRGEVVHGLQAYPLRRFEEKPTLARARRLAAEGGGIAWNAGIFLWRRRAIRDAVEAYQPGLLDAVSSASLGDAYRALPPISIDYAVMEPAAAAGRVVMGAMDVGWSDLGGWSALLAGIEAEGTGRVIAAGDDVVLGPRDLMIHSDGNRLVVTQGPSGTIRTDGPAALLLGAAGHRHLVAALLDRVAAREAQLS
jgi:mannose-1-phosphate guanylyltransferase/mannose-1-phosphate guanylyltransferase/mannose-6-phosphate isomerase